MFISVANNKIIGINVVSYSEQGIDYPITNIEVSDEVYNNFIADNDRYIYSDGAIIENPDYEEIKRQKHRQELDALTLTPADVERALYYSELKMDFNDLKAFIHDKLPELDIKGLGIEFRAKDFYRGAIDKSSGARLFDVVGQLLGYTPDDMDYLFINKELPVKNNNN